MATGRVKGSRVQNTPVRGMAKIMFMVRYIGAVGENMQARNVLRRDCRRGSQIAISYNDHSVLNPWALGDTEKSVLQQAILEKE